MSTDTIIKEQSALQEAMLKKNNVQNRLSYKRGSSSQGNIQYFQKNQLFEKNKDARPFRGQPGQLGGYRSWGKAYHHKQNPQGEESSAKPNNSQ